MRNLCDALLLASLTVMLGLAMAASSAHAAKARPLVPDHPLAASMADEDKIGLETIAGQPETLHPAILEVATHDDVLVQLPAIWNDFELGVAPLTQTLEEDDRKALQHLLQHPGLLDAIVSGGPNDEATLQARFEAFPPEVRTVASNAGLEHYELMRALQDNVLKADAAFEALISTTSPEVQAAFREVVGHPELTSLLLQQLEATRQLGGAMRVDPRTTPAQFASLGREVRRAQKQAEEQAERQRIAEERARREAVAHEEQRQAERRARRLYWGRYPYWGSNACWYGDPHIRHYGYAGHRHCWYPWHRYRRAWW